VRVLALSSVLGALVTFAACARTVPEAKPAPPPPLATPPVPSASASTAPSATADLPGLDDLAALGPSVAAGMREVARGEIVAAGGAVERGVVQAGPADTCIRLALAAQPPIRAWLTDGRGDRLAEVNDATRTLLAPSGPVCARKGDTITVHVEAHAAYAARFVAWASP
jgi:hypothetical protein